jgi:hypothetical protein
MEILVAILVIALIAAIGFAVMQRGPAQARGRRHRRTAPIRRARRVPRSDPMMAAVVDHAEAIDPADVVAAEQRLQAQAREVAAPLQAEALRIEHERAAAQMQRGR